MRQDEAGVLLRPIDRPADLGQRRSGRRPTRAIGQIVHRLQGSDIAICGRDWQSNLAER
jgi:hypothetical protein